ncbi:MAG: hypothetical protein ACHQE5_03160, partial [Actinomycetes bacterium]
MRRLILSVIGLLLALGVLVPVGPVAATVPGAHPVREVPATGALFYPSILGVVPLLGGPHVCSGSVVH